MSYRTFADAGGARWQVRVLSKSAWRFEPIGGNPADPRRGAPPLYAGNDPFELSDQELQRILADALPQAGGRGGVGSGAEERATRRSPFGDVYEPPAKGSPFGDDTPPAKKNPFSDEG